MSKNKGYINLEVAKLAFDLKVQRDTGKQYTQSGGVWHGSNDLYYTRFKYSHLQEILRDEYGIIVYVVPFKDIADDVNDPIRFCPVLWGRKQFKPMRSWDEAMNEALKHGLNFIPVKAKEEKEKMIRSKSKDNE